ncbi:kinetochore protein SPC24 homolog [Neltuma alba]|uniref:kinetochore protein SPC24 homolog n=1 Tax=Neltuma alba TaxID=207710 RepID=UPI0010A4E208|nr:kinetochore protein SPC24 homolog [Prosopis alba]
MDDSSRKIDLDKLFSYSDDLIKVLKDKRDINCLTQYLEQSNSLSSSCNADFNEVRSLLEDYQKKIDECKQKTAQARSEVVADAELDLLQKELEEELEKERTLGAELRACSIEFNDLEQKRISILERKKNLQKLEQDELRTQMMLSMYASVTNIIPNLDDQSKISGYIVEKDKNLVEKFEYDPSKMTALDVCNEIWKIVGS